VVKKKTPNKPFLQRRKKEEKKVQLRISALLLPSRQSRSDCQNDNAFCGCFTRKYELSAFEVLLSVRNWVVYTYNQSVDTIYSGKK
jgi:hypothetical protein